MTTLRKHLSLSNLLSIARKSFSITHNPIDKSISPVDCLMSGLAVFQLKYPSLLQFDKTREEINVKQNLRSLYDIKNIPSDTHMRRVLDEISPKQLRKSFKKIFSLLQRGKAMEEYRYLNGYYLLALDGTGQYASNNVKCEECCEKHHRNDTVEYYHQMLGAVIIHPNNKIVIPLAPEPITKQDGATKNDCERNAAKRLLTDIRREHPHLKLIVTEDALASNGPHIDLIKSLNMSFILGVKPDGNKFLFDWTAQGYATHEVIDDAGITHQFRFFNDAPLNDTQFDTKVNFLWYREIHPSGKIQIFSWITDFLLTKDNVMKIMKGGRARWKIENETFNTLKNQGYNFEHNYGHGNKHLCSVFTMLMLLSFLIDQAQELCCAVYKAARKATRVKYALWEIMRSLFKIFVWNSWEEFFMAIIKPIPGKTYDTT